MLWTVLLEYKSPWPQIFEGAMRNF